jgi:hypothetical protein
VGAGDARRWALIRQIQRVHLMSTHYILKNIRVLLTEGFTDEDLRRVCYDIADFRPVYNQLARNSSKAEIIDRLLEHSYRTLQVETLLTLAKEYNPARYEKHQPYYNTITSPITSRDDYKKPQQSLIPLQKTKSITFTVLIWAGIVLALLGAITAIIGISDARALEIGLGIFTLKITNVGLVILVVGSFLASFVALHLPDNVSVYGGDESLESNYLKKYVPLPFMVIGVIGIILSVLCKSS